MMKKNEYEIRLVEYLQTEKRLQKLWTKYSKAGDAEALQTLRSLFEENELRKP